MLRRTIRALRPCHDISYVPASYETKEKSEIMYSLLKRLRHRNLVSKYDNQSDLEKQYQELNNLAQMGDHEPRHDRFQCDIRSLFYDILQTHKVDDDIKGLLESELSENHLLHRREEIESYIRSVQRDINYVPVQIKNIKDIINEHRRNILKLEDNIKEAEQEAKEDQEKLISLQNIIKDESRDNHLFWNKFVFDEKFKSKRD